MNPIKAEILHHTEIFPMLGLPNELQLRILRSLPKDIRDNCARVCSLWHALVRCDQTLIVRSVPLSHLTNLEEIDLSNCNKKVVSSFVEGENPLSRTLLKLRVIHLNCIDINHGPH